jgi:U3 small nucleolar RNA-associated protein 13
VVVVDQIALDSTIGLKMKKTSCEKKALRKQNVLEAFFSGPEDKRTTRIEISDRLQLMFCSFKRKVRVGSDIKIVSLKTGNIVQTIPPQSKYSEIAKKDQDKDESFSFLQANRKKMERSEGDDFIERDHVVTFNTIDLDCFASPGSCETNSQSDKIHVVTAHASGLMKEWFVGLNLFESGVPEDEIPMEQEQNQVITVQLRRTWRSFHQSPMTIVKFSESSAMQGFVASGGTSDSTIKVWDLNNGYCTHSFKLKSGKVSCVAFHCMTISKKTCYYLLGSGDLSNTIQIFDLEKSTRIANLEGHISSVTALAFLNETTMISTSRDKILITWNLETFVAVKKMPVFESIEDVIVRTFGKKTQVAITVGQDGMIKLIDPLTGRLHASTQTSSHGTSFPLKQVLALEDEIISISDQNHITFHSVVYSGGEMSIKTERQLVGELDQVLSVKFIGDDSQHLVVASNSPLLKIYCLNNRNSCQLFSGHADIILNIEVVSWNRNLFISSSKDNSVKIWRFTLNPNDKSFDASILYTGAGHFRSVTAVAVANKATSEFFISGSEDSVVKVWKTPKSVLEENDKKEVGQLISMSSLQAHEKDVNSISISPNDQFVATGSKDKTCKVWSIDLKSKQMKLMATLRGHRKTIWSTDFSPVDKILLTASGDCSIRIWSLTDFGCLRTMSANDSAVYVFAKFISNGTQVIASSTDALLRVFSVKTAELTLTVDPILHSEVVTDMNISKFTSVKKNQVIEDVNAEDNEDDDQRIWSLDFDPKEDTLVFGSGSKIFFFEDSTSSAKDDFLSKKDKQIVFDQKLQNLLKEEKYGKALHVAINLEQPGRCLDILRRISLTHPREGEIMDADEEPDTNKLYGFKKLEKLLESLRDDQLFYLLKLSALNWNTNSKHYMLAQTVMKVCLPRVIAEILKNEDQDLSSLTSLVEAMICFTERHEARIKKQCTSSHLVNFLSQNVMKALPIQDLSLEEPTQTKAEVNDRVTDEVVADVPCHDVMDQTEQKETNEDDIIETNEEDDDDLSSGEEMEIPKRRILGELSEKQQRKKMMAKMKAIKQRGRKKTHDRL